MIISTNIHIKIKQKKTLLVFFTQLYIYILNNKNKTQRL
jgi:hypothetical protein